jgi:predicted transcriptional regulator
MAMMGNGGYDNDFYLTSSHGAVLFFIAVRPGCTIREIAAEMALTQRTVWGLIGDLRRAGMLHVVRQGRRHHYTVNMDAEFRHPVIKGVTLRTILGDLAATYAVPSRNHDLETSIA